MNAECDNAKGCAWASRMRLASAGWRTNTRLSRGVVSKGWHFQMWACRYDWNGFRSDKVYIMGGAGVDLADRDGSLRAIRGAVLETAAQADDAWSRFPTSVPCQLPDGSLVENSSATLYAFGPGTRRETHREALPEGAGTPEELVAGDRILIASLDLAAMDCCHEDKLMPVPDCSPWDPRRWEYRFDVVPRSWHGQELAYQPIRSTPVAPFGSLVAGAAEASLAQLRDQLALHRPGSLHGGLPPGMMTRDQKTVADELALRARLARGYGAEVTEMEVGMMLDDWRYRWGASHVLMAVLPQPTEAEAKSAFLAAGVTLAGSRTRHR